MRQFFTKALLISLYLSFSGNAFAQDSDFPGTSNSFWKGSDGDQGLDWNYEFEFGGNKSYPNWDVVPAPDRIVGFGNTQKPTSLERPEAPLGNSGTINLNSPGASAKSVVFFQNNSSGAPAPVSYTIGSSSTQTLNLSGGIYVRDEVSVNQTVQAAIQTAGTHLTIANYSQSPGTTLTVNGNITSTSPNDVNVTIEGPGRVQLVNSSGSGIAGIITVLNSSNLITEGNVSGSFSVQEAATLEVGGSPGAIGTLTAKSLSFENNSIGSINFIWDSNALANFDRVALSGALTVNPDWTTFLNIMNSDVIDFDVDQTWQVFTGVTSINGDLSAASFEFWDSVPAAALAGEFSWEFSSVAGTVNLNFSAVPEPSSMLLLGASGTLFGVIARRRGWKLAKKSEVNE